MKELIENLLVNPYISLISILFAVLGIFLSVYFYFKSKKFKKPSYLYESFSLIEDSISGLEGLKIIYDNEEVKILTLTKFSFWNYGRDTIEGNDIANMDKLRIMLPENEKIIRTKQIFERKKANNISLAIENNKVYINFDFLDYGDGVVFEIYHTSPLKEKIEFKGTIKGASGEWHLLKQKAY